VAVQDIMVRIEKKVRGGNTYYYLYHGFREGKKYLTKQKYIGTKVPEDLNRLKQDFIRTLIAEKYYVKLEQIKQKYSKEIDQLPPSIRKKRLQIFAVKFTYNTQRIEGSKLTLRETSSLLKKGITPSNKPTRDVEEAQAHKKLFFEIISQRKDLSYNMILEWHRKLFKDTKPDIAGAIRNYQVGISGSRFRPPLPVEVYPLMQEFIKWYNKTKKNLTSKEYRLNPVELVALVHFKFATIHPFGDGNGRISRLLMNFVLNRNNYPMLDLPYTKRKNYYNALESAQIKKNDYRFVTWFIKRYIKEYVQYLSNP
jgi:Fic family protein